MKARVALSAAVFAAALITSCQTAALRETPHSTATGAMPTVALASGSPTAGIESTPIVSSPRVTPTPAAEGTPIDAASLPPPTKSSESSEPTFGPAVVRQGDFQLTLTSSATEYDAGQPISVLAEFAYLGNSESIKISSLGPGPLGWGIFQRDGPMYSLPDWSLQCGDVEMTRTEPITQPFTKMDGLQGDGVSNSESRQWLLDPDLKLPAGRWVIYVKAMAGPDGSHCQDWQLQASTEVVVK